MSDNDMERMIGIKTADGNFFPAVQDTKPDRKRLLLTTVKDNQNAVRIDLYHGYTSDTKPSTPDDYITTLFIENIPHGPKGSIEIELQLQINKEGKLQASAIDNASDDRRTLSINLQSSKWQHARVVPQFSVPNGHSVIDSQSPNSFRGTGVPSTGKNRDLKQSEWEALHGSLRGTNARYDSHRESAAQKRKLLVSRLSFPAIIILIGGLLIGYLLAQFLPDIFFEKEQNVSIPLEQNLSYENLYADQNITDLPVPPPKSNSEESQSNETNSIELTEKEKEVQSDSHIKEATSKSSETGKENILYYPVWGDTLWDLAQSFYQNPWLYKKIADKNNLHNPDRIYVGQKLQIPEVKITQ